MIRFALLPPGETRPSLLVYVAEQLDAATLQTLREEMIGRSCASGLAIDPEQLSILHDDYGDSGVLSIQEEARLPTDRVLSAIPAHLPFHERVERWLYCLAGGWRQVLPRQEWVRPLLLDVIPAAAEASVVRLTPQAA